MDRIYMDFTEEHSGEEYRASEVSWSEYVNAYEES